MIINKKIGLILPPVAIIINIIFEFLISFREQSLL